MKTVGISNLKNSLSRYIRMVKAGEHIFITDHNKIVAEIIPSTGSSSGASLLNEYLTEQSKKGLIRRSTKKTKIKKTKINTNNDKKILEAIYEETRDDRLP
jgi:antitoxin (DNA-binding transcriptional repressor) of toxin-antitoxin stability system